MLSRKLLPEMKKLFLQFANGSLFTVAAASVSSIHSQPQPLPWEQNGLEFDTTYQFIKERVPKLNRCFTEFTDPMYEHGCCPTFDIKIAPSGKVLESYTRCRPAPNPDSEEVEECIDKQVKLWRFPRALNGRGTHALHFMLCSPISQLPDLE